MSALFVVAGIMAVLSAIGVIAFRTPVHSVLSLVLSILSLSALFLSLEAEFMAIIQIIVYAGAIMVLFLFVIALLSAKKGQVEHEDNRLHRMTERALRISGLVAILLILTGVRGADDFKALHFEGFGSVDVFGDYLLTTFVLPFELTSLILMVAVIGVVILVGRKEV